MIDRAEILWGVVAPPLLMAIGMAATAWIPGGRRVLSTGAWLAIVFGVSQLGFRGWVLPGNNVQDWPAWIAFAAGGLAWCSLCGHGPFAVRLTMRVALTAAAAWLLLKPQLEALDTTTLTLVLGAIALGWTVVILAYERVHAAVTAGVSLSVLTALVFLSSLSLLFFNSMIHAQFAGILTAALTAALVLLWWRPAWYQSSGVVTVVAVVLPTLLVLGYRYADLPWWTIPFLLLAGLAPLATLLPQFRQVVAWKRIALALLVVGLLAAPVVVCGVITSLPDDTHAPYGY